MSDNLSHRSQALPGAGMLYAGRIRIGVTWLVATVAGFFVGLVGVGVIRDRNYRVSAFGIFLVAMLTWLAVRCILSFAAAGERNAALGAAQAQPNTPGATRANGLLWLAIGLELVVVGIGLPADHGVHDQLGSRGGSSRLDSCRAAGGVA